MNQSTRFSLSCFVLSTLCISLANASEHRAGLRASYTFADDACESQNISCDDDAPGAGIFYNYAWTPRWELEVAYDYYGQFDATYPALDDPSVGADYEGDVLGLSASLGYRYPVSDVVSLVGKAGVMAWHVSSDGKEIAGTVSNDEDGFSPLVGVGVDWDFTPRWRTGLSYQFANNVGDDSTAGADLHTLMLGISYRFSGNDPQPVAVVEPEPEPAPQPVTQEAFTMQVDGTQSNAIFEFNSAKLRPDMTSTFQPMLNHLNQYPEAMLRVETHTDDVGSEDYNMKLSQRRAQSVVLYFEQQGITPDRISYEAFGETKPLVSNDTPANRAMNRRVVLTSPQFTRKAIQ
ncbi:OmpA family protein [Photobacterium halotolerans]|uniref:OmpA family protein n=1 Tax=Photobacterium halotolerans TaxID=265726 RepID=UPI0004055DBB|nr:OmpA family protein [Photobacterium halotolerans]